MKKIVLPLLVLVLAYGIQQFEATSNDGSAVRQTEVTTTQGEWHSGDQVQGSGKVIRVLSDDNEGSRHQRFIIELSPGRTLLVAHNIDLAPRVEELRSGDAISFNGVYEWNDRGGVIHWTHLDPQGRHIAGWIEHRGRRYQ